MKKCIGFLLMGLCLLATTAFAAKRASVMTKDVWVVGTESTYPPFEFRTSENELVGFDIDVVGAIAEKLGKKVEWVDMSFDGLIPALMTQKLDMVAAGLSNTPERREKISFSAPYYHSLSAFCVLPGNEQHDASGFEGKTIASQLGTVQDFYVKNNVKNAQSKNFQKSDDCLRELIYGRVDAVLLDGPVAFEYVQSKDFKDKVVLCALTEVTSAESGMAMGVPKGDEKLIEAVNKVLADMTASGEMKTLRDKWGLDDWQKSVKE